MSDTHETTLPLLVQSLRYIQSASHVLAECLARFSEEPMADKVRQMERLCGVAFLMDLVSEKVEQAQLALKNEIASR